jgi:predicted unusual protein kinase regulating ubiquinone biosynthesis (AarF/ABC1/UbiB family)
MLLFHQERASYANKNTSDQSADSACTLSPGHTPAPVDDVGYLPRASSGGTCGCASRLYDTAQRDVLIEVLLAFRETAVELGVLMIKLGQFLSSRVDLLPEKALASLASLQDEVPPAPFDHVVDVIESELGKPVEDVFSLLERKCTAAASLGQVHKAILASTGETVAVKIQRPHSDQLVRLDLRALKVVIWVITRCVKMNDVLDLMEVYHEFERTIYEEIDYVREAANANRFKEMFKDDPMIYIPRVYDQYVSRRVLVLEWIDGIKINDYATLDAAGIDRFEVAKRTVCAYFYQFFQAGFFHADPHPGNIFVKRGSTGGEPIVTFVDFGMVGSLTNTMKRFMKHLSNWIPGCRK